MSEIAESRNSWIHRVLARDIGAPLEGTIVSAATIAVVGAHADRPGRVVVAWAVVLVVYWLSHVYLHALRDQLRRQADPLHRRLVANITLQAGVLLGGVPVIVAYVVADAVGTGHDAAVMTALVWTVFQMGATVLAASLSAKLSPARAIAESLVASAIGFLLIAAKSLLH